MPQKSEEEKGCARTPWQYLQWAKRSQHGLRFSIQGDSRCENEDCLFWKYNLKLGDKKMCPFDEKELSKVDCNYDEQSELQLPAGLVEGVRFIPGTSGWETLENINILRWEGTKVDEELLKEKLFFHHAII